VTGATRHHLDTVPELLGHQNSVTVRSAADVDAWARKGWVDLRAENMLAWQGRFRKMLKGRAHLRDTGSAAASIETFMATEFEIGEVVAWIFNNEMGGYRVK